MYAFLIFGFLTSVHNRLLFTVIIAFAHHNYCTVFSTQFEISTLNIGFNPLSPSKAMTRVLTRIPLVRRVLNKTMNVPVLL